VWSLLPITHVLRKRLTGRATPTLIDAAVRSWELAPGEPSSARPAYFLPDQLDRVTGWAFSDEHPRRQMQASEASFHGPTRGFLLENVWLIDGTLYGRGACLHLQPRINRFLNITVDREIDRAAIYCTPGGNKYFGQWLMDDCVTYPLARAEGVPYTTDLPMQPHTRGYEDWLGMAPIRASGAFFRELVIFDDVGQNRSKRRRFRGMGAKLSARVDARPHPGVFILRGRTGARRLLRNELELAERLRVTRGFRILDATQVDVPTIVSVCAGARTVIGVEGSGLMHGILVLGPGASVVTLQPPGRFVGLYKHLTDRDHQHFAFVVGLPQGGDFDIDADEVERTLDLLPR
jgi:hypothetical protein